MEGGKKKELDLCMGRRGGRREEWGGEPTEVCSNITKLMNLYFMIPFIRNIHNWQTPRDRQRRAAPWGEGPGTGWWLAGGTGLLRAEQNHLERCGDGSAVLGFTTRRAVRTVNCVTTNLLREGHNRPLHLKSFKTKSQERRESPALPLLSPGPPSTTAGLPGPRHARP